MVKFDCHPGEVTIPGRTEEQRHWILGTKVIAEWSTARCDESVVSVCHRRDEERVEDGVWIGSCGRQQIGFALVDVLREESEVSAK